MCLIGYKANEEYTKSQTTTTTKVLKKLLQTLVSRNVLCEAEVHFHTNVLKITAPDVNRSVQVITRPEDMRCKTEMKFR
jgi:hypothetical protein